MTGQPPVSGRRPRPGASDGASAEGIILLDHRVGRSPTDPLLLSVSPEHFAEHLEVLRSRTRPMRLGELVDAINDGNSAQRTVVLTFDDGYADNLTNAKPLLARYDACATVFPTTGDAGHRREFWWDELDRLLLQPGTVPKTLHMTIEDRPLEWDLSQAAHYSPEAFQAHRRWNVLVEGAPCPRQELYRALCRELRALPEAKQCDIIEALSAWAGAEPAVRSSHRALSPDEIVALAEDGTVEIGAHTVTHTALSALTPDKQRAEITDSKSRLERIVDGPVTTFSYPYGLRSDYGADTVSLVRSAGFDCACAGFNGTVGAGTDSYQLPRMVVRDWDGDEFSRRLRDWQQHG